MEKPMYIIQERIIPVPKRQVEEITVKIPKDKFEAVVNTQVEQMELQRSQRAEEMEREGRTSDIGKVRPSKVEGTGPKYKHVPKGVEVPVLYYKPKAVERLIDRNVPVPVELHVVQEIQCPTLIPSYALHDTHIHIHSHTHKYTNTPIHTHKHSHTHSHIHQGNVCANEMFVQMVRASCVGPCWPRDREACAC